VDHYSYASIKSLILPSNSGWNVELLEQLFSSQETDMIKRIPLSRNDVEDKLM